VFNDRAYTVLVCIGTDPYFVLAAFTKVFVFTHEQQETLQSLLCTG